MNKNILCITGGTAGHVLPALALQKYYDSDLLVEKSAEKYIINTTNYTTFQYSSIYNIFTFFRLFIWALVKFSKYETIITFGCYVSLPFVLAAWILRKKRLTHEQNAVVGRANKIALFFGFHLLSTFYIRKQKNQTYFGMPVFAAIETPVIDQKYAVVFAGSLGSEYFDEEILPLVDQYSKMHNLNFIIQVRDMAIAQKYIDNSRLSFVLYSEIKDNIPEIIACADFIISRAGAGAIAYYSLYRKKALLIPLPHAKDNHQYHNAILSGFSVLEQKDINQTSFFNALLDLKVGDIKLFIVD